MKRVQVTDAQKEFCRRAEGKITHLNPVTTDCGHSEFRITVDAYQHVLGVRVRHPRQEAKREHFLVMNQQEVRMFIEHLQKALSELETEIESQ